MEKDARENQVFPLIPITYLCITIETESYLNEQVHSTVIYSIESDWLRSSFTTSRKAFRLNGFEGLLYAKVVRDNKS